MPLERTPGIRPVGGSCALILLFLLSYGCVSRADAPQNGQPKSLNNATSEGCSTLDCLLNNPMIEGPQISDLKSMVQSDDKAFQKVKAAMADLQRRDSWGTSVLLAGLTGNPAAYPLLREFLVHDYSSLGSGVVPADVYHAKANVPLAMGLLLRELNSGLKSAESESAKVKIREFLTTHTRPRPDVWRKELKWETEEYRGEAVGNMYLSLTLGCIQGIGVSRDSEALRYFDWLEPHLREQRLAYNAGTNHHAKGTASYPKGLVDKEFFDVVERAIAQAKKNPEK